MRTAKLGTCLAAAAITLAGSTYLASPAAAEGLLAPCSSADIAYANGYVDGVCGERGFSGGSLNTCVDNGNGTFTFTGTCS